MVFWKASSEYTVEFEGPTSIELDVLLLLGGFIVAIVFFSVVATFVMMRTFSLRGRIAVFVATILFPLLTWCGFAAIVVLSDGVSFLEGLVLVSKMNVFGWAFFGLVTAISWGASSLTCRWYAPRIGHVRRSAEVFD